MPKTNGLTRSASLVLVVAAIAPGCSTPGPLTSRHTMIGGLKADISLLESEKEELRKEIADLKSDNNRISNELVAERALNGDLATRLDGARNILRSQGLDRADLSGSTRSDLTPDFDAAPSRRASPGRRPATKPRQAPFAEIPSPGSSLDPPSGSEGFPSSSRDDENLNPQARRDSDYRWLPVARGTGGLTR
jgi:hypothetical protein